MGCLLIPFPCRQKTRKPANEQRQKRPYKKLDNDFWDKGGKLSVAVKYKRISRAVLEPIETENLPQTIRPITAEVN